MTIVYKVLNPLNGEYLTANTPDECAEFVADLAINMLNSATHNAPYSVVEINEDGSQVWRNPVGSEIIQRPSFLAKATSNVRNGMPLTSIPLTPVETLP